MKSLRALVRLLRGLLHIAVGVWTVQIHFPQLAPSHKEARVQAWAQRMLVVIGIRLEVRGTPAPTGPMLLVANHISWLDILVMHAARHCRFVSKSDIQHWPLIGALATGADTLYIARESRRDALRMVHEIAQALHGGEVVAVFPEGTTGDGLTLLPFHANLIQAAITAEAMVQPVALSFVDQATGQTSLAPCYTDSDTLLGSVWRTLKSPGVEAVVTFGEPQAADGRDRRTWAKALRDEVARLRG